MFPLRSISLSPQAVRLSLNRRECCLTERAIMSEQTILEENPNTEQKSPAPSPPPSGSPKRFEREQIIGGICLLGIVTCFFAPWVGNGVRSGFNFYEVVYFAVWFWAIPLLSLLTLASFQRPKSVQRTLATITAVTALLAVGYLILNFGALVQLRWGASLTVLFALVLFGTTGEQRMTVPINLVAHKLGSRKGRVYSHSFSVPTDVHFSAKEFYAKIQTAIQAKQWPGVKVLHIDHTEAGMLSHKREYLRIIRQRHFFDLCASSFGQDYFFSIREAEIPAAVSPQAFFALLTFIFIVGVFMVRSMGLLFGGMALLFIALFIVWLMTNALKMGMTELDNLLLQTPIIGPAYEAWFRPDTYFQQDGRIVFLHAVNELTKKAVEETVSAKGLKFLDFFEQQPILGELYKRSRNPIEPAKQSEK